MASRAAVTVESRLVLLGFLFGLLSLGLAACYSPPPSTPMPKPGEPSLMVSHVWLRLGDTERVAISVAAMPNGGLAAIQAVAGGFTFNPKVIEVMGIRGQGGFEVLASWFDNSTGKGGFAAIALEEGVEEGGILELVVRAVGNGISPLVLERGALTLADEHNVPITSYSVFDGEAVVWGRPVP